MYKLPRDFYTRADTLRIAKELLGKILVVPDEFGNRVSAMIVETEAYLGIEDKAAHSYNNRRTKRTETMYKIGGTVYVFFVYGMYNQFNVVAGEPDRPHAILIRAVEPRENIELMRSRRISKRKSTHSTISEKDISSGPGKLCIAMGIDRAFDGEDLLGERVWIEDSNEIPASEIYSRNRIGIDYAEEFAEKPWRFYIKGNAFVSKP